MNEKEMVKMCKLKKNVCQVVSCVISWVITRRKQRTSSEIVNKGISDQKVVRMNVLTVSFVFAHLTTRDGP